MSGKNEKMSSLVREGSISVLQNKTALVARPAVDPAGVGTVAPLPAGVVGTVGAWGKRLSFLPLSETEYLTPWTLISVVGFVPPAASGCLLMPAAAVF